MSNHTLSISLATPGADESDYILIEQEPWPSDMGRTSVLQGIQGIYASIFGSLFPDPNCGGLNGFDTPIYLFPSRSSLNFTFALSHGEFVPCISETLTREEVVQCGLQDSANIEYPPASAVSLSWIGKCYDENGNELGKPTVTVSGRKLSFSEKVYGSIRARYQVYRKTYNCRIEERDDSIENNFESVAYARWDGGIVWLEINPPSGYDATLGDCGNGVYGQDSGGTTAICAPAGSKYPSAARANRVTKIEYCSQEVMSDETTEIIDYDNDKTPCHEPDDTITTN
jgi:hypothetical protein